jgi:hypothetical protein
MNTIGTKPAWLCLLCCVVLLGSGCASRVSKATYPERWSPPAQAAGAAQCPLLSGRYVNAGETAPGTKEFFCDNHYRFRGTWCGQTALSQNIGDRASGDWVELRQPDNDTLVIVSSDPTVAVEELHQSKGDFTCSGGSLERHLHASSMSAGDNSNKSPVAQDGFNAVMGAMLAVGYASGGVRTLTRRFSKSEDGALVMAVSQSEAGVVLLIPFHEHDETFVRWTPERPMSGDAAATSSPGEAAAEPTDLPSAHVGIFDATNGKMWSKVKVTNLDGAPVNTYLRLPGVPIAMDPGSHWVQVGAPTTRMIPLRDVDTKYAFMMEAVAGHRYRIAEKPPSCLAPGNIDAALSSSSIYHTRLAVVDEAPGAQARSIEVQALCVSARTFDCAPGPVDRPDEGMQCVVPEGWTRGYYGKDAGLVPPQ